MNEYFDDFWSAAYFAAGAGVYTSSWGKYFEALAVALAVVWALRFLKRTFGVRARRSSECDAAVREFATFLATTASPKGTVQREKLQGFATEFLGSPGGEK